MPDGVQLERSDEAEYNPTPNPDPKPRPDPNPKPKPNPNPRPKPNPNPSPNPSPNQVITRFEDSLSPPPTMLAPLDLFAFRPATRGELVS